MTTHKQRVRAAAVRRTPRRSSDRDGYARVMRELKMVGSTRPHTDPIVEQLKQCPEAFKAGEMVGKMFDALKYSEDGSEGEERYLPPAGVVMPLV
jgi:hypothetical protein